MKEKSAKKGYLLFHFIFTVPIMSTRGIEIKKVCSDGRPISFGSYTKTG
jgi:hypothetical protein